MSTTNKTKRGATKSDWHCARCKTRKPKSEFYVSPKSGVRQAYCNPCRRERRKEDWKDRREATQASNRRSHIKQTYGLDAEAHEALLVAQHGRCAICKQPPRTRRNKHLSVDHDHATGRVRGLLCLPCNTAIALLNEDIERLQTAIRYLKGQ